MKHRAIKLTLAAIFVSSLAFADSPTDAPLLPNDDYAVLLHQEKQDIQSKEASPKSKRSKKKDESVSSKAKSENPVKANRQNEQSDRGNPAANGNYAGSN